MRTLALLVVGFPLIAQAPDLTPFEQEKASILMRTRLSCLGCHEFGGEGGRLAPSLTDVAQRRSREYIRAIVEDPQRVRPGAAMPKVPMPPATRELVIAVLSRGARAEPIVPTPSPGNPPRSASELYGVWCATCHGARGAGDGVNAGSLPVKPAVHASAAAMSARSDDALFDVIAGGGAIAARSPRMPPFGSTLSREEIRSLVAYIRLLCACEGPSWSRPTPP